jgi:hypothetical protein
MMAETLAALALAHMIGDYVLQSRWMVDHKRGMGFVAHIAVVFVALAVCLGQVSLIVVSVALAHTVIDLFKTFVLPDRLWSYLLDQLLHIISIIIAAWLIPQGWQAGFWADMVPDWTAWAMVLVAGIIFTTRGGLFALAMFMAENFGPRPQGTLPIASTIVGSIERLVVFGLILVGLPWLGVVALAGKLGLLASRGALVGPTRNRALVGTLVSFSWAVVSAYVTLAFLGWIVATGA